MNKNSVLKVSKIFFSLAFAGLVFSSTNVVHLLANSVNLMPNPTFAPDPANPLVPLDWKFSTFGTNTAVSGYPVAGPTENSIGLQTTITDHVNGFADWYGTPVPVTALAEYFFSNSYKSDVPSIIEAEYTINDPVAGNSISYRDIAYLPSSNGAWANSSTTFVVPAGATSVRLFHLINGVGNLTISNPFLVKTGDPFVMPPDGTNLISNPTFTPDPFNTAVPKDWKFSIYGTTTATNQYPAPGPNANTTGLKTIVTSHTYGFADWFNRPVPATAFAEYNYSDTYLSDATGVILAQYTIQDPVTLTESTIYTDIGFTSPTNGAWNNVSIDFIAPPGATSIMVYHVINNVGSLTIANPSLIKTADPATFPEGMVSLTFDDGYKSYHNTVLPMLEAADMVGTFYITTQPMIDAATDPDSNYLTADEVMEINRAGHEIANHTVNHCNLATVICPHAEVPNSPSALTAIEEIVQANAALNSIGALPVDSVAYPYGEYNESVKNTLQSVGMISGRAVHRGYNLTSSDRYALKIQYVNASSTTAADFETNIKPWIETARKYNVWLIILFHDLQTAEQIASGPYNADLTTKEVLQATVNYLKQNNVKVVTVHDAVCMMAGMAGTPDCNKNTVPGPLIKISTSTPSTATVGIPYAGQVLASSSKAGDVLSWNVSGTPSWMNVSTTSNSLSLTGTPTGTSTHNINITVKGLDPKGNTANASYILNVNLTNSTTTPPGGGNGTTTPPGGGNGTTTPPTGGDDEDDSCSCFTFKRLKHAPDVVFGNSWDGAQFSLQNVLNGLGFSVDTVNEQENIQTWKPVADNSVITVKALARNTTYDSVFGYFQDGVFHPIYKNAPVAGFESTPVWSQGTSGQVTITGTDPVAFALYIANTGKYVYTKNSLNENGGNYAVSYNISDSTSDKFIIAFEDIVPLSYSDNDYNDNVTLITVDDCYDNVGNHRPVITLLGSNPATINVGENFIDPGATAHDQEDGDITSDIITSSTVNKNVPGTYTITYNVTDSDGLAAVEVTRIVKVLPINGGGATTGKITFCKIFGNNQNVIATSSTGLPAGNFSINFATSTHFGSTTVQTITWNTSTFTPNKKLVLNVNDANCITVNDLNFGTYYYSQETGVTGQWNTPKYNDQYNQPINNVFDFYPYSGELFTATTTDDNSRNLNSDGHIVLDASNRERTVAIYNTYNPATTTPGCTSNCGGGGGSGPSSDIEVTKTADKSTANPGDTVTYTIKIVNKGPNDATGVNLLDTLPSTLTFVSSTSTLGSFATTSGMWTIGNLANNASTTLTIVATINSGTHGVKISNTAVASSTLSDPNSANNTSTSDVNINSLPGGGGGGGGNGPIVGSIPSGGGNGPIMPPTAPNSCYYLYDYLRKDFNNNPVEVKKLQVFLRDLEGFSTVQITGVYDDQTIVALDAFQERYKSDILTPWGHTEATSYTYILTKKKVNEIYCKMAFPVTPQQQIEIDTYRQFLQGLKDNNIILPGGSINPVNPGVTPTPGDGQVGSNNGSNPNGSQGTLAGLSSTTANIFSNLSANVLSAGKRLASGILGFFGIPFSSLFDRTDDTTEPSADTFVGSGWLNVILVLIIVLISYLWYREYRNNRKIEEINKEIDLE